MRSARLIVIAFSRCGGEIARNRGANAARRRGGSAKWQNSWKGRSWEARGERSVLSDVVCGARDMLSLIDRCGENLRDAREGTRGGISPARQTAVGAWLSLARAPGSGPGGRWFKSTRPDHFTLEVLRCAQDFACGLGRPHDGSSSNPLAPTTSHPRSFAALRISPADQDAGSFLRRLAQEGSTVAGSRTAGEYFSRMAKSS